MYACELEYFMSLKRKHEDMEHSSPNWNSKLNSILNSNSNYDFLNMDLDELIQETVNTPEKEENKNQKKDKNTCVT